MALAAYRLHEAAHLLYHFFWHEFCDWYIELKKLDTSEQSWRNLLAVFEQALRLLHPFMPFITEELWQRLTSPDQPPSRSLPLEPFPCAEAALRDQEAERVMAALQEAIVGIRNIRAELKVEPKRKLPAEFYASDAKLREAAAVFRPKFERLAGVSHLTLLEAPPAKEGGVLRHWTEFDVRVPLADAVDPAAERLRLRKEQQRLQREFESLTQKLENPAFRQRAPRQIVAGAEQLLKENLVQQKKIEETLARLA